MDELDREAFLKSRFETLLDEFEGADTLELYDINAEAEEYFREFLEAGFDADLVAMLLAPDDVVRHYAELTEYGATIDIEDLI
ncbi:hypothetical protein IKX73_01535 [Candidatus Saccharibacteria bacterium]|nr:hypothetical protein [Candidatus Saccharibacteria bacterium]